MCDLEYISCGGFSGSRMANPVPKRSNPGGKDQRVGGKTSGPEMVTKGQGCPH